MTLVEQPAPYRCKHGCERDTLLDRITAMEAREAELVAGLADLIEQCRDCEREINGRLCDAAFCSESLPLRTARNLIEGRTHEQRMV